MALQLQASSEVVASLNLLDGSHSYVAAYTEQYKTKNKNDMAKAETEAMCAFLNQLMSIDYLKVSIQFIVLRKVTLKSLIVSVNWINLVDLKLRRGNI